MNILRKILSDRNILKKVSDGNILRKILLDQNILKKYYQMEVQEELRRIPSPFLFAGFSSKAIYPQFFSNKF